MIPYTLVPAILGILGLCSAWLVYLYVRNASEGDGKVKEITVNKATLKGEKPMLTYEFDIKEGKEDNGTTGKE